MPFQNTHQIFSFRLFLFISTLFLISNSYASNTPEPQRIMEETSKVMLKHFIAHADAIKKDHTIAYQIINESLVPKINFVVMSQWIIGGKNWRKAGKEQQQQFITEFTQMVVKFYSKALITFMEKNDLSEDIITFKPYRGKIKDKYATVRSQVNPPGGAQPVKVNYELYYGKSGLWQVFDVSVEGLSLVHTYRSEFKSIIAKKGMLGLIEELRKKHSKLAQPNKQS